MSRMGWLGGQVHDKKNKPGGADFGWRDFYGLAVSVVMRRLGEGSVIGKNRWLRQSEARD